MAKAEIQITAKDAASRVIGNVAQSLGDLDKRSAALTKSLGGLASPLAALGGLVSVAGIAASVKSTADYADGLGKLAQRAGVTATAMSELSYAASLSNVSQEEVAKALQKIAVDAENGGKKLGEFGIKVRDLDGNLKTSDQLLKDFADRIARMGSPSERSAAAIKLLGEEGSKLVPLLSSGSKGLRDMADEAERFGKVVSDDAAKAAADFNDNLTRMTAAAELASKRMGNVLIPILGGISQSFLTADKHGRDWLETLMLVARTGVPAGGMTAGTVSRDLDNAREELKDLEEAKLRYLRANSDTRAIDEAIVTSQTKIGFLTDLLVQKLPKDNAKLASLAARIKTPALADDSGKKDSSGNKTSTATARVQVSEAERYILTLRRQLEGTQQLTRVEEVLRDLQLGRIGAVTESQRAALLGLAAEIDASSEFAEIEKQFRDMVADQARKDAALKDEAARVYEQTRTPLERLNREEARLNELLRLGVINADTHARAVLNLNDAYSQTANGAADQVKKTDDLAKDLGLTFSSAFEDAIVGGKGLQGVLAGLEADIMRIVTRKLVTEPLGDFVSSAVGGFDWGSLFSFDGGGYTGPGGRYGGLDGKGGFVAMLHPQETVIDHTKGGSMAGKSINVVNNFALSGPVSRETQTQLAASAYKGLMRGRRNL